MRSHRKSCVCVCACAMTAAALTGVAHARQQGPWLVLTGQSEQLAGDPGGARHHRYTCPVFVPEVFDVTTETWTALTNAPHTDIPRAYHSVALMLPDGSVWTAGQDQASSCPPPCLECQAASWPSKSKTVAIYRPPYYFDTSRPTVDTYPATNPVQRGGSSFNVGYTVDSQRDFGYIAIRTLDSVTHSVNMTQRYLILNSVPHQSLPDTRVVTPPPVDYAPPGYYMLLVVDDQGIPSVAKFIRLE